ncbi:MAG: fatty acid desaturase [Ilumatobacteraceae bacterium]
MTATISNDLVKRDYRLTGPEAQRARERGLADARWFQPVVEPSVMRSLQERSDARASLDTTLWIAALIGAGLLAWWSLGSWWAVPAFALYGALYGGSADARWHEAGHGTAFRTGWANEVVYHVACFMLWRGPTLWRWSHYRHHTDTIIVGRDAEIVFQRPPSVPGTVFAFTHLRGGPSMFIRLVRHATVGLDAEACDFIPEHDRRRAVWEARVFVGLTLAVVVWATAITSIVPLLFIGLPTIYGAWLMVFFGLTQHAGMREDVLDHRLNTRTVMMNPLFRFLYLNMNYHVEHHIFPSVPYHALPKLHTEIRDQLAPPIPNTVAAYRQIFSALRRQSTDPTYELDLDIPDVPGAEPDRIEVGEGNWARGGGPVSLGSVTSVAIGGLRRVDVGDRTYVLCRLGEDEVALLDGLCTHGQVHLADGALLDGQLECPKHNGRFDARTGAPCRKPIREALGAYEVEVRDGRITTEFNRLDGS